MSRHIALVAPPCCRVPPDGYGGVELVVALLVAGLRQLGDHVTLFAAPGSAAASKDDERTQWDVNTRPRPTIHSYLQNAAEIISGLKDVDVLHDHCGIVTIMGEKALTAIPSLHTAHGPMRGMSMLAYRDIARRSNLIAVSDSQQTLAPTINWYDRVHNAVDVNGLRIARGSDKKGYLLCLARVAREKGQHLAIEVARRVPMPLVLAGPVGQAARDLRYFHRLIEPAIDGHEVVHLPNVAGSAKAELLAGAAALLAPLQWEEPFGLALVEAMASGTPAIALRRGAAPELISEGVTGFLTDTVEQMAAAVGKAASIDPDRCAGVGRSRFHPDIMVEAYKRVYERLLDRR